MKSNKGGLLVGHTDKDGGIGIQAVTPSGPVLLGGGEKIIVEDAHNQPHTLDGKEMTSCEVQSTLNQEAGGVPIPCDVRANADKNPDADKLLTKGKKMESGGPVNSESKILKLSDKERESKILHRLKTHSFYSDEHLSFELLAPIINDAAKTLLIYNHSNPLITRFGEGVYFIPELRHIEREGLDIAEIEYVAHFVTGYATHENISRSFDESKFEAFQLLIPALKSDDLGRFKQAGSAEKKHREAIVYAKQIFNKKLCIVLLAEVAEDGCVRSYSFVPKEKWDYIQKQRASGSWLDAPVQIKPSDGNSPSHQGRSLATGGGVNHYNKNTKDSDTNTEKGQKIVKTLKRVDKQPLKDVEFYQNGDIIYQGKHYTFDELFWMFFDIKESDSRETMLSKMGFDPDMDLTMEEGGSVEEKIESRLKERQKGKEFKDTGVATYTRKYQAAYDVIKYSDLADIEKDNVAAYKLIEKSKIWPAYNVAELKESGNTAGAAYMKVKCREFLSARPLDSKDARDVYVKNVTKLMGRLELLKTTSDVSEYLEKFADIDTFDFGDISHFNKSSYISSRYTGNLTKYSERQVQEYFENIFSKKFYNFCRRKSDPARKIFIEASLYEEFTQFHLDSAVNMRYEKGREALKKYTDLLAKINEAPDSKDIIQNLVRESGISYFEYNYTKAFLIPWIEKYIARWSNETKESIKAALPKMYTVRENDWSWANVGEKKEATKVDNEGKPIPPQSIFEKYGVEIPKVLKRTPLEYIKRTGGLEIGDVKTSAIKENYGFKNVIYGNYVNDAESKEHTKHFLGSMLDLVETLNIDIRHINKIGGLDINFGATGCGPFSPAFACYFPSLKAINLTKKQGDGSIAHEWGHYLDNVLAEGTEKRATKIQWATVPGNVTSYKSERVKTLFAEYLNWLHTGGTQRQVTVTYNSQSKYRYSISGDTLAETINKLQTRYPKYKDYRYFDTADLVKMYGYLSHKFNDGKPIDVQLETKATRFWVNSSKYSPTSYYLEPQELFARMFEQVIEHKLKGKGRVSNYLVDVASGMGMLAAIIPRDQWPYPAGEELEWLSDWVDRLFSAIRVDYGINPFVWGIAERVDEYTAYKAKDGKVAAEVSVSSDGEVIVAGEEVSSFMPGYGFRMEYLKDAKGENRVVYRLLTSPHGGKVGALGGKTEDVFVFSLKPFGMGKSGYGIGTGVVGGVPLLIKQIDGKLEKAKEEAIEYFKNNNVEMKKEKVELTTNQQEIVSKAYDWLAEVAKKQGRILSNDDLWTAYPFKSNGLQRAGLDILVNTMRDAVEQKTILTEGINTGDEGMYEGQQVRVTSGESDGHLYIEDVDDNGMLKIETARRVNAEEFKKSFAKFPKVIETAQQAKEAAEEVKAPGGRGWFNLTKGPKVESIDELRIGDILLLYTKQFNANNTIKIITEYKKPIKSFTAVYWNPETSTRIGDEELGVSERTILNEDYYFSNEIPRPADLTGQEAANLQTSLLQAIGAAEEVYKTQGKAKWQLEQITTNLGRYFDEIIAKNPNKLYDFLNIQIGLPSKATIMASPCMDTESTGFEFRANVKSNIWDLIPESFKEHKMPKKIHYKADHKDPGLHAILKDFVGHDDLRPVMHGAHFDSAGITATDAQKILFLHHPGEREEKNHCVTKKCIEEAVQGKFPNYKAVIPNHNEFVTITTNSLFTYLKTAEAAKYYSSQKKGVILDMIPEAEGFFIGFDIDVLLPSVEAMARLGYEHIDIGYSAPNRAITICNKGEHSKVGTLGTTFALVMPVILGEYIILENGVMYFNVPNECVKTMGNESVSCINPIHVHQKKTTDKITDLEKRLEKKEAEAKPEFVNEAHGIKVNEKYNHDAYGNVEVESIEVNKGDKKDVIPFSVNFKTDAGELEQQGINGFVKSTTPKGPNQEEVITEELVNQDRMEESEALNAESTHRAEVTEAIELLEESLAAVKGKAKKEIQEAIELLKESLEITMATGGRIENQYEGKTAKEVWESWTEKQRRHFLFDHRNDFKGLEVMSHGKSMWHNNDKGASYSIEEGTESAFGDLPFGIREELGFHVGDGQYDKGGAIQVYPSEMEVNSWTKEQCVDFLSNNWGFRGVDRTGITLKPENRAIENLRAEVLSQIEYNKEHKLYQGGEMHFGYMIVKDGKYLTMKDGKYQFGEEPFRYRWKEDQKDFAQRLADSHNAELVPDYNKYDKGGPIEEHVFTKDGVSINPKSDEHKDHIFYDKDGNEFKCLGYDEKIQECWFLNVSTGDKVSGCAKGFWYNKPVTKTISPEDLAAKLLAETKRINKLKQERNRSRKGSEKRNKLVDQIQKDEIELEKLRAEVEGAKMSVGTRGYGKSHLELYTDEQLGKIYTDNIGYNPFEEGATREEVLKVLKSYPESLAIMSGGGIPNNYIGKTPNEIWTALTHEQRGHFLADHSQTIFGKLQENFSKEDNDELIKAVNTNYHDLPKVIKFAFDLHAHSTEYSKGGKIESELMEELAGINAKMKAFSEEGVDYDKLIKRRDEIGDKLYAISKKAATKTKAKPGEGVDLFETPEHIPAKIEKILNKYEDGFQDGNYKILTKALKEVNAKGYTFDYGLDGGAYDLRKIGERGKSEDDFLMEPVKKEKGGRIQKEWAVFFTSRENGGMRESKFTNKEAAERFAERVGSEAIQIHK